MFVGICFREVPAFDSFDQGSCAFLLVGSQESRNILKMKTKKLIVDLSCADRWPYRFERNFRGTTVAKMSPFPSLVRCPPSKIRFFWEPGAFDAKGEFVHDRFKSINKVRAKQAEKKEQAGFDKNNNFRFVASKRRWQRRRAPHLLLLCGWPYVRAEHRTVRTRLFCLAVGVSVALVGRRGIGFEAAAR